MHKKLNKEHVPRLLTRREVIVQGLVGAAGLTVLSSGTVLARSLPKPVPTPAKNARAKAVIQIWMWGGPSHLDTFDPKPEAGYDYCGPLNKPIPTKTDGVRICQLLPLVAQQSDKYTIIHSMTHSNNSHETASYIVQTGHWPGRLNYPGLGSIVSLFKGYDHGFKGLIPPYIILTRPQGRFSPVGFLGPRYQPFVTGGDPNKKRFIVEGVIAEGITDQRQSQRRDLLHTLDTLGKAMPKNPQFVKLDKTEANAYELILGNARDVFDLTQEKDQTRDAYGHTTFGQSCLMARRLVEKGIPYVTINYPGWDTHKENFQVMNRRLPEMDKGMSTLLQDLSARGLLDSTIVWWGGEFGRTPKIMWNPPWNGGRGHWGYCFSHVVAGGGFKGGQVLGASDAKGEQVAKRAVYPDELLGTMLELLGIDPDGPLPNRRGLKTQVMPLVKGAGMPPRIGRLTEII